ncbi:MAG: hypothetical protein MZW92_60780 [Comamonadaceae bacterium]|nr:hypothetical protein [Comamonadaceae bacterium]
MPIELPQQREAPAWARAVAAKSHRGRIRWPDCTFEQAQNRFYHIVEKRLGISLEQCGVTPHGLRHSYAQRFYARRTGLPTPVQGGALGQDRLRHAPPGEHGSVQRPGARAHWRGGELLRQLWACPACHQGGVLLMRRLASSATILGPVRRRDGRGVHRRPAWRQWVPARAARTARRAAAQRTLTLFDPVPCASGGNTDSTCFVEVADFQESS